MLGLCLASKANTANGLHCPVRGDLTSKHNNCHVQSNMECTELWLFAMKDINADNDEVELLWPYGCGYRFLAPTS